jgi:hypothetical protein
MATRRTALTIWYVFVGGVLVLTVVGTAVGPRIWSRVSDARNVVPWVVFGMALGCLVASKILPSRIKPVPGATPDSIAVGRSVVATALNGAIALQAPLAWMISGKVLALVALAISLVGLLLAFPSERRWQKLCQAVVASGGHELVAGGDVQTPEPWSRKLTALFLGNLALSGAGGAAVLILMGNVFWTTQGFRRPASPIIGALISSILALMMTGFAVVRFKMASAGMRPRRHRVHGVLLLVFAGYLLVQAFWIASTGW